MPKGGGEVVWAIRGKDVVEEEVQQSKMKGKSEMQQLQQDDVVLPKVNLKETYYSVKRDLVPQWKRPQA